MSQEPINNPEMEEEDQPLSSRLGSSGTLMVLFYDHWFAIISLCILLFAVFLGLFLPRIWRQTPAGFSPIVKVSGLDLWQARSLRRAAVAHFEAGRFNEAMIAWNSAIANNPGDADTIREALRAVVGQANPPLEHLSFSVSRAFWLLQLARTNANDMELTLDILGRYTMDEYIVKVGGPWRDQLTPSGKTRLLRAYFDAARYRDFGAFWDKNADLFRKDPELTLYHQAWLANWGEAGPALVAQDALRVARNDPALRVLANRLQLGVSFHRQDLPSYAEALHQLVDDHADRFGHHIYHWLLLNQAGHKDEARELALNYPHQPTTPAEAGNMAVALRELGMLDQAITYLDQQLPRFGFEGDIWLQQGRMLIEGHRWLELRALAISIRNEPALQSQLDAYSYFVEAIAESHLERPERAADAADRILRSGNTSAVLAREMAHTLRLEGFAKTAVEVLRPWRIELKDDAEFWFEYAVAAFTASAEEDIGPAAARAYELRPADLSSANNQAAALIAFRRQPEEAVKLTLRVMASRPNDIGTQLNHVLALLQIGRLDDAERRLRQMNTLDLGIAETTIYYLAWFELDLNRKEWTQARAAYGHIDLRQLLSVQTRWLDQAYRSIPAGS